MFNIRNFRMFGGKIGLDRQFRKNSDGNVCFIVKCCVFMCLEKNYELSKV